MKIVILGAGFSGLAVCWHLLQLKPGIEIELLDPQGIGGGASGIAAGLLHPYVGMHCKYNRLGNEGMAATEELLGVASAALGRPVFSRSGILRLAITPELHQLYSQAAATYPEIRWCTTEECRQRVPSLPDFEGILIPQGITVSTKDYLQGLWQACQALGAVFRQEACESLAALEGYDAIVVAAGATFSQFSELSHLPVKAIKGQVLELRWPDGLAPLPLPLNALSYLLMNPKDPTTCIAGATYERNFTSALPDCEAAKQEIMPKLLQMFPQLEGAEILSCQAGLRATTPNREPLVKQVSGKCWVITGMSSRGLLYHALMARKLALLVDEVD
jgi:glycine/D-amino acid oxidase-like deaminating enzyme